MRKLIIGNNNSRRHKFMKKGIVLLFLYKYKAFMKFFVIMNKKGVFF